MAYETLKGVIRQYIKTNGNNEITGQILQNVLIEMVDNYPSLAGYATQSWVWNTALSGYLPLTGGTLTGALYGTTISASNILCQGAQGHAQWGVAISTSGISVFSQDPDPLEPTIETTIGYGTVTASGAVTAGSFVKSGGTSSQFLKADGSVDSNTYLTSVAFSNLTSHPTTLSGYGITDAKIESGTITLGSNTITPITSLSGYATQQWVQQNYLPLTGGTLTGGLTVSDPRSGGASALINSSGAFKSSGVNAVSSFNATFDYTGIIFKQTPMGGSEVTKAAINAASGTITATGSVTAGSFVKSGGTSSQFLKADGSVDSNAYITSSALSGYATQTWVGLNYLSLSNGGEVDGLLVANDYIQTAKVYGFDNEALLIQGSDTDGTVQIDAAGGIYLTTDGNSSWIFCEDLCCKDGQNKWKITMSGNASFKNLYLYDLNISEGNAGYNTKYLCVKNGVLKFFDGTNEKTVLLQ